MDRRDALKQAGLALGGLLALSGCTEEALEDAEAEPPFIEDSPLSPEEADLPVDRTHAIIVEGIEAADAEIEDVKSFERYLVDQGLLVEEVLETESIIEAPLEEVDEEPEEEVIDEGDVEEGPVEVPIVELEYVIEEQVEEGTVQTIGIVAGAYAALLEASHDSELLEANILDPADVPFGSYEIEGTWAEEYTTGEISAAEYGDKVLTTVETD
ncbi:hypothetical protein [Halalkalicoccus tibetensis]|uniref:DUF8159 domain-containing protein n=1 Tax=Halalkalicoccus tibetensis TaxID=175632 RepID=A0ABD5V7W1_9EURY